MVNPKIKDNEMDQLCRAILLLESEEECYQFFEDVCTISEIKAMSQRLQVARMLQEGKTYQQIESETGASTATISRVKRYLNYGAGGYQTVLSRLEMQEKK
ncbi:YerC/YecD family TrpR-related protein [Dethiobacter alkaliphilus]|uniref:YerC/YecD family TrpR-related protein n=1 Tax=Dethiobacter alkaliphilus TaxID=427926 RepID=UPI0029621E0D|nr:YerC/YecD family TrpR-related protein [Dethiobacter alkaliphilus]